MKHGWKSLVIVASVSLAACTPSAYLESVSKYGQTVNEGTTSLETVPKNLSAVCHKRAIARYIKRRILSPADLAPFTWVQYYDLAKEADGVLSWSAFCNEAQNSAENFSKLVELLGLYAAAMKTLASMDWDGQSLTDLTTNLSELAGSKTDFGKTLGGLAPSAKALGKFVASRYAEQEARDLAKAADEPIRVIIAGLTAYLAAVVKDLQLPTAKERKEALELLEMKGAVWNEQALDAGRAIVFIEFAQTVEGDSKEIAATLKNASELLKTIGDGQHKLAAAPANKEGAADVLAAAANILVALNKLREASSPASEKE